MEFQMPKFKQYLAESILSEKNGAAANADLIFQKMLDVLDHAHLDFDDDRIAFHIGRITKNSKINLRCVIRNSASDNVRLGKDKTSGDLCVVIDTRKPLPLRAEIDSFLAKDRERAQSIKACIQDYLETRHAETPELPSKTKYEEEVEANTSQNFETRYEAAIKKLKERMNEFKGVVEELESAYDTEDVGKKATIDAARRSLVKEYFGEDVNAFKKIVRGLMSKDDNGENNGFANNLSKENKERLDNRLESFYDQHIKPLLSK